MPKLWVFENVLPNKYVICKMDSAYRYIYLPGVGSCSSNAGYFQIIQETNALQRPLLYRLKYQL